MAEEYGEVRRPKAARRRRARGHVPAAPVGSSDALLSVRGLTVAFSRGGRDVPVVTGVDFEVGRGEALGILGESGCGKSVTARSILGLLPGTGRVTAGSVVFEGRDLLTASEDEMRAVRGGRIGWISQEPITSLDPAFTIGSQLVEAIRAHRTCSRREARARALELLALVRLPDPAATAAKYPHELSGGMAQRAGIAGALAADPVMLIADEPTTALDVTVQAEILDLLRDLQATGMAIMLVTHDLGVLADLCERAVVMYAGEVVETAGVAELTAVPGHPYTAALLSANPHDAVAGSPLRAIEGAVPSPEQWSSGCRFANRCPLAEPRCEAAPVPLLRIDGRRTRCVKPEAVGLAVREKEEVLS
jgi:peptide/nickel transport system permease protein